LYGSTTVVKRKDEQAYGAYRTKHVILDLYDAMQQTMETGTPYRTRLAPPPAHGWTLPEITLETVTAQQGDRGREDAAHVSAGLRRRADTALSQSAFHFDAQNEVAWSQETRDSSTQRGRGKESSSGSSYQ
jgi:hypothetical protein